MANNCKALLKDLRDSIRYALRQPDLLAKAEPVCDHCGRHGHTKARCQHLQECHWCGQTGHWKDHCPHRPEAPRKPPAGYQCTQCKAGGDHYSADSPAKAKANFTQAKIIAAIAAEFTKQYEVEQQAAKNCWLARWPGLGVQPGSS